MVILMGLIIFRLQSKKPMPVYPSSSQVAVTTPPPVADMQNNSGLYAKQDAEAKKMTIKRDPLSKITTESSSALFLNGVAWDDANPQAIINNEILEVGGSVNGNTVVEIKEDRVILSNGKNTFELKIEKEK